MTSEGSQCIFCHIINNQAPATIVYKDDTYVAFKDIKPVSDNHLLVVPHSHIQDVKSLTSATSTIGIKLIRL